MTRIHIVRALFAPFWLEAGECYDRFRVAANVAKMSDPLDP
jgi:hypothetical protein